MPDASNFIAAGLSYRQLDHWTGQGYLKPSGEKYGSGRSRVWPSEELRVARAMVALTKAGFAVKAAHDIARLGPGEHDLGDTVRVVVREGVWAAWPTASKDSPTTPSTADDTPSTGGAGTTSASAGSPSTTEDSTSTESTPAADPTR